MTRSATRRSAGGCPRALTPFRTPAYRWLAVSLTASSFAAGVWVVALVWEVIRARRGPGRPVVGHDRQRHRRAAAGAARRRGGRPGARSADPRGRGPRRAGRHGAGRPAVVDGPQQPVAARGGRVRHRHGRWPSTTPPTPRGCRRSCPSRDLQAVNGFEGMVRPTIGQAVGPGRGRRRRGGGQPGTAFAVAAASSVRHACSPCSRCRRRPCAARSTPTHAEHPVRVGAARHARGLRLHGAHAVAARDAAVRLAHGAGDDGPARGAHPVPRQGPARRRPERPRVRAGRRSASVARSGRSSWRRCGCRAATSP